MAAPAYEGIAMNASMTKLDTSTPGLVQTSYKFQRLREKIRRAVESGELKGKLPGERALARRFHVNAKTLSKALTDLAAEGLLDRSIGRGTFVRGSIPSPCPGGGKWLLICNTDDLSNCLIGNLRAVCPDLEAISNVANLRPSFLNQFTAVVNLSRETPDAFLRDLLVRNLPVVGVNYEPTTYSMHSVSSDVGLGVQRLARDLILAGHRRLGAVEPRGGTSVAHALRQAAGRYACEAVVEVAEPFQAATLVETGITALVCGSVRDARQTRVNLADSGIQISQQVSLVAVGCACADAGCSGYFVECQKLADAVIELLGNPPSRPVSLWLPGQWIERATLAPIGAGLQVGPSESLRVSGVMV
jgi:hypothetical protein